MGLGGNHYLFFLVDHSKQSLNSCLTSLKIKFTMNILKQGNVVKSKTSEQLMIINRSYIDKSKFNKNFLGTVLDDIEPNDSELYIYVCFIEENGLPKKLEFKRDELIFVRDKY